MHEVTLLITEDTVDGERLEAILQDVSRAIADNLRKDHSTVDVEVVCSTRHRHSIDRPVGLVAVEGEDQPEALQRVTKHYTITAVALPKKPRVHP